jgi:hypothetical protein
MKRGNFVSGLLAAPLALKARMLALFQKRPIELCGAPIGNLVLRGKTEIHSPLGQALIDRWAATTPNPFTSPRGKFSQRRQFGRATYITGLDQPFSDQPAAYCSRPRGHNGPHALLFTR